MLGFGLKPTANHNKRIYTKPISSKLLTILVPRNKYVKI